MAYDFSFLESKVREAVERLVKDVGGIRTGRATAALLDGVFVSAYGSTMKIDQVASVTAEDARTLHITPWDHALIKDIEKSIAVADLGVSARADASGVRVSFPELTTERRDDLVKQAKARMEEARVSLRRARDEVWSDIQKQERAGVLSEDDKFRLKDAMEKLVKEANEKLEGIFEKKEKEIRS